MSIYILIILCLIYISKKKKNREKKKLDKLSGSTFGALPELISSDMQCIRYVFIKNYS